MAYWLFKSEPDVFGWDEQVALGDKGGEWHGVRNYQARNNMRAMKPGDRGFFYHSQKGRTVVGIVEVALTAWCAKDLKQRPAELVRGPKLLWAPALSIQPVGPLAYLLLGRKR